MVELKGSLNSLGLPAIAQLIGELHHSGNLELTRGDAHGVLGFVDGRLVSATLRDQRGLKALAACTAELADADFVFVEGAPGDERTLDLGGSALQKQLKQFMNGEVTPEALDAQPARSDETPVLGICPLLGFVDDETRHYSRPTAMHRCFAGGAPSLVTGPEQRELCLSGRYTTCPRFRNHSTSKATAPSTATSAAPVIVVSPPRPGSTPDSTSAGDAPTVPAGVAARMAAADQLRMSNSPSEPDVPAGVGADQHNGRPPAAPEFETRRIRLSMRPRRGLLWVASGVVGLLLVVAGVLLARLLLNGLLAPRPSSPIAQPAAVEPTLALAPATVTRPIAVPTLASAPIAGPVPTATLPPRPPTPTVRLVPTVPPATAGGQALVDVRFASGAKPGWLDNPPFVAWSDGAYRFQARQPTHFVAVSSPIDRPLGDVVVSATFRKTGGPPGGGYGLVVRDQGPDPLDGVNQDASFYVVEAGDLGDVGIWRRDRDHWVDLVPWAHSDSVRPGGSPNDLVVRAIGDKLTFMVNETQVASVQDDTLAMGGVGVFVGGDYNEVALDRFVVQVPD
ncbi:MAG TPA: DUF4388 domain-containing protein [Chloroflexota bacterium]|nr:DUF4388 domain-containing protein [Chloroflexota bacterium]